MCAANSTVDNDCSRLILVIYHWIINAVPCHGSQISQKVQTSRLCHLLNFSLLCGGNCPELLGTKEKQPSRKGGTSSHRRDKCLTDNSSPRHSSIGASGHLTPANEVSVSAGTPFAGDVINYQMIHKPDQHQANATTICHEFVPVVQESIQICRCQQPLDSIQLQHLSTGRVCHSQEYQCDMYCHNSPQQVIDRYQHTNIDRWVPTSIVAASSCNIMSSQHMYVPLTKLQTLWPSLNRRQKCRACRLSQLLLVCHRPAHFV